MYQKGYTARLAEIIETFGMQCHTLERHSIYKCFLKGAKDIKYLVEYGDDELTKLAQMQLMIEKLQLLHSFTIEHWERHKAHLL